MVAIEKENPSIKGVLTKDYTRRSPDKTGQGEVIDQDFLFSPSSP